MDNLYDVLKERGFLYQATDEDGIRTLLGGDEPVILYIGFDPTADSLHVGSLVPIMSLVHAQRCGHRPIVVVGCGTAMVGDPSGKSEMRQMLTLEELAANAEGLKGQLSHYLSFGDTAATMVNNQDWLSGLGYIEFLRDVGKHISVNRMLTAESVKLRLEKGLSFLEFNYMLLQAYDFMALCRDHDCVLQMGGQDQWGNIVAGIDLCRRMLGRQTYGLTFPLLMNPSGEKFGKTAKGTSVWLDPVRTSPYDFYQFWRNIDDSAVARYMGLFSLLPMDEVRRLAALTGDGMNRAKEILAYEATKLCHGTAQAAEAFRTAVATFGGADPTGAIETSSDIPKAAARPDAGLPTTEIPADELATGLGLPALFVRVGLCGSNGEAKKLVKGGGAYLNDERVQDIGRLVTSADLADGAITLRAGKKRHHRVVSQ